MIAAAPPASRILRNAWPAWRPPPRVRAREWIPQHVRLPDDTENPGPFDLDLFPHVEGVLEAADDPDVRVILLPWSSRLGKTVAWLALLAFYAANYPRPGMIGREDEDAVDDLIESQVWPILEACLALADELPPKHRRNSRRGIRLRRSRWRKAYSGAPGSMAGFPAAIGFASELSKWQQRRSTEADPVHLFLKRGWGFPFDSKYLLESTPSELGRCRITQLCDQAGADVRRREVRCPHCGTWQLLRFGDRDSPAGLKWDKLPDGRSDPQLAEETAWYQCAEGCRIEDQHRLELIRSGVWLSENQTVDRRGRIRGKRPAAAVVAFGHPHPDRCPFGALYSTQLSGWGQLAREWLTKKGDGEGRREFANQTAGEVWDPAPQRVQPSQLVARLGEDLALGIAPDWSAFLTAGVDVGQVGDEWLFYWLVAAWGALARGHVVDYGIVWGLEEFARTLRGSWPRAGGSPLSLVEVAIDSSAFTDSIYEICRPVPAWWPVKGSSSSAWPDLYRPSLQSSDLAPALKRAKVRTGAYDLLIVNTHRSQTWLEDRLTGHVKRSDAAALTIPREALTGQPRPGIDLPRQLLGDMRDEFGKWIKRYEDQHARAALRYARTAAEHHTRNGQLWPQQQPGGELAAAAGSARQDPERERFVRKPSGRRRKLRRRRS